MAEAGGDVSMSIFEIVPFSDGEIGAAAEAETEVPLAPVAPVGGPEEGSEALAV